MAILAETPAKIIIKHTHDISYPINKIIP